jgi:hypothetical protein
MLFLNSIWLFAIAALSIPVIIHLWNIKPGKTLKVGSIALITAAAQKSSRSFKLNDLLLFLMRCLLLLLLAFVLAGPVWQRHLIGTKAKGWLLIPKENISESYHKFKPLVDSLTKAGYEFHYFNKGFAKADLTKVLADSSAKKAQSKVANYWSTIAQLNQQVASTMPVYLITPNGVNHFTGTKSSVALNLKWKTYTLDDSVSSWIERAWFTSTNDVKVVQGNSKASGTYFTNYTINSGGDVKSPFTVSVNNGKPVVKFKKGDTSHVNIDTATIRFAVFTDKYNADASYLKAALQAIGNFSQHKISIKQYNDAGQIPDGQNGIFWLSDKPLDNNTLKKTENVFQYETGKVVNTNSWIKTNGVFAVTNQQQIALFKLINGANTNDQLVWQDGFGDPVLSVVNKAEVNHYHFYSRFNPAWNDLVWSDDFPQLLFGLIFNNDTKGYNGQYDRRVMDQRQLMPYHIAATNIKTTNIVNEQTDLFRYFWLALVVVFIIERLLAHQNKLTPKNG